MEKILNHNEAAEALPIRPTAVILCLTIQDIQCKRVLLW